MNNLKEISVIIIFGVIFSLGLIMNSGYFSHDEIGWGIKAIYSKSVMDLNYYSILNYDEFHYRPLNFNLWLFLSYYLFEMPQLFHLVILCMGLVNSILIYFILKGEFNRKIALLTALFSTSMPTIIFVNGWIGTIADIFWFMFCSLSFLIYQNVKNTDKYFLLIPAFILYIAALMFKETAVVFPGAIFLYVFYTSWKNNSFSSFFKDKSDQLYFVTCTLLVLIYLIVRFEFLFPSHGGGYGTSLLNIPTRMLEYFIYPFLITNIEIHGVFQQHSLQDIALAFALHLSLIIIVCGKNITKYFLYFGFYFVTSVPILILDMSLPHYIYASGFVIAFVLACLIVNQSLLRVFGVLLLILLMFHSVNIQKNYVFTGMYQNNFVNTLYSIISSEKDEKCNYLVIPDSGSAAWIAIRAIAFRNSIDDLNIENRVNFGTVDFSNHIDDNTCILKLDTKGRVQKSGLKNDHF